MSVTPHETAMARLGGLVATGLADLTSDIAALDSRGRWAVVIPYAGTPVCARFDEWRPAAAAHLTVGTWHGPRPDAWQSSLDREAYCQAVEAVRSAIARGEVYQANITRLLSARLPDPSRADIAALHVALDANNPSPFGGMVRVPGCHVATASPELFLRRRHQRIESSPIKGTAPDEKGLLAKDRAENVMIVDLVRNDLSRVCTTGSIDVPVLLETQEHPGLVHLVSTVSGGLRDDASWPGIMSATFPAGSISGAPKSTALRIIDALEVGQRGVYCGAIGWVDADERTAELAVAIRTFWLDDDHVRFGTGAGITWGSDPQGEWEETELKAARLIGIASRTWQG